MSPERSTFESAYQNAAVCMNQQTAAFFVRENRRVIRDCEAF